METSNPVTRYYIPQREKYKPGVILEVPTGVQMTHRKSQRDWIHKTLTRSLHKLDRCLKPSGLPSNLGFPTYLDIIPGKWPHPSACFPILKQGTMTLSTELVGRFNVWMDGKLPEQSLP